MKTDLDRLMRERGFEALVIMGNAEENHALKYLTNHAKVSHAIVVKKQGSEPVIICNGMERDEAAKSGLEVTTMAALNYYQMIAETGSAFKAQVRLFGAIFEKYGIKGTVSFYGTGSPGSSFIFLKELDESLTEITVTGETENTIFDVAYATKDAIELEIIKSVASRTNIVMEETMDFIKGHDVINEQLTRENGDPLTIADVKRYMRARLLHYGLQDSGNTIFALGRDAGVPHSRGEDDDILRTGVSIIFDLFPRDIENGYFHDMTRTFCLGYAPAEVQQAYEQVMQAFNTVMNQLEIGKETSYYQELACDVLEEYGHPTLRTSPGTEEGYVHSLGHGLGLEIHADPRFSSISGHKVEIGQVVTIEPGVYYPEKGYGVRIEDTVYFDENGQAVSLTTYPKDLVIPVENNQ